MLASAVLTGALLVGDSVDHSLRTFAMLRLGGIENALDTRTQYLDESLATRLDAAVHGDVTAALQLRGMAIYQGDTPDERSQINKVSVYGVEDRFWAFGTGDGATLGEYETAINAKLATALGVEEGDEIALRVAKPSLMARDSPLSARDDERSSRARYKIARVVSDESMGRFGLNPSQTAPYNAFVNRAFLQKQVEMEDRINLILAGDGSSTEEIEEALSAEWHSEDIGLKIRDHESGIIQLESDRIFLSKETARAGTALPNAQGALTYLVTTMTYGDKLTPYFFAVAGPVPSDLQDDEMVINRWTADELGVGVGGVITLDYAVLQPSNEFTDESRKFTVHSIREMSDLNTERELMPMFPGLSDVESCADWDIGMTMDEDLQNDPANQEYWDEYRQTPKAFVTLAAGQDMWQNRFGTLTSVRYTDAEMSANEITAAFREEVDPALLGLFFIPVGEQASEAATGSMDFGGLFVGMSFFLIVAALLLTGMLFVFGVQQRASQLGTLQALGYPSKTVRRLILGEGFIIATIGVVAGAFLGTFYTRALIYGLSQNWQGAIANATILYHAEPTTLIMGAVITLTCAMTAMWLVIRSLFKRTTRDLLTMDFAQEDTAGPTKAPGRIARFLPWILAVVGWGIVASSFLVDMGNAAPAFFGAGALLLLAEILFFRSGLTAFRNNREHQSFALSTLAKLNLTRRPGRSVAVVSLLACGCFLVFAVSSMQEDMKAHADDRSSGTGGFALLADATFPLLEDPAGVIEDTSVSATAIKVRDGDDASCLNLNKAQTPRLLGVSVGDMSDREAFVSEADDTTWALLNQMLPDGVVPALVGDSNTALWMLKKKTGVENGDVLIYKDEAGNEVPIKLVGQLPMRLSVFQGSLLISDEIFTQLFPSEDGHRMFLIDAPEDKTTDVIATFARRFDRYGLDTIPAVDRVLEFYAVESTYLAMFLVLGGLGLAIGSIGMAVVVLRNLFERRGELAMLQALGFSRAPVYRALFSEYGSLMLVGLVIGGVAAIVSMVPAILSTNTEVAFGTQARLAVLVVVTCGGCMALAILTGFRKNDVDALRDE
jgi:hypothetical protein